MKIRSNFTLLLRVSAVPIGAIGKQILKFTIFNAFQSLFPHFGEGLKPRNPLKPLL